MVSKLWTLVQGQSDLDPRQLAEAIRAEWPTGNSDPRTRQLMGECFSALQSWNVSLPAGLSSSSGETKFPSLPGRIHLVTTRDSILRFLRDVGRNLTQETKIIIGGSSSLILDQLLQRATEDVDLVDEVPEALRNLGQHLVSAQRVHNLHLAHFQSHYLPDGWEIRLCSLGYLGRLLVYRVDSLDVFVGKLFSNRERDRQDVNFLAHAFPLEQVKQRMVQAGQRLLADPKLRQCAEHNWYVLYGEELEELNS